MPKHVLFVSYDGMTDPLGQSQVLPYLIGLQKKGYKVSLISFEKPERFQNDAEYIQQICDKAAINWHPLTYTKRPPVLSTVFDIWKMKRKFRQIHAENSVDLLHCRSYISAFLGLKHQQTIPWIFDMRGFWADERVEGNIWNIEKPLYRKIYQFFKKKELRFFNESTAIVSLTHAGKKEILSWKELKIMESKIAVIPCCVDLNLFDPTHVSKAQIEDKRIELGLGNKYVVGYIGSIGTWYLLKEMLLAFKTLQQHTDNCIFLFVTKEPAHSILEQATQLGIQKEAIKVVSALHQQVPVFASLFHCSIFFIKPSFSKTASSPTKQGELMAMGIPIICNSGVGDTAQVVEQYQAGLVVNLNNLNENALSIPILKKNFNQTTAKQGAHDFYSLEAGISKYDLVYKSCLSAQK